MKQNLYHLSFAGGPWQQPCIDLIPNTSLHMLSLIAARKKCVGPRRRRPVMIHYVAAHNTLPLGALFLLSPPYVCCPFALWFTTRHKSCSGTSYRVLSRYCTTGCC